MKTRKSIVRRPEIYQLPSTFLSTRLAIGLLLFEVVFGVVGYIWLEGYSLREALYMVAITVSTVGYTEVRPLSPDGQIFTSVLILLNVGIFAYGLSVFSYYFVSGEIFRRMHFSLIGKKISQLENHVIICGFGRYGRESARHFAHHDIPFLVVERDKSVIEEIQKSEDKILYIEDDATKDETLQAAGIDRARALIAALPDDSENLFIVLTARQLNRELNIVSRATEERSQRKLELAGASHVIMPNQIGGFYMATLVSRPGATEFFTYITRELESDIQFEEVNFEDMPPSCRGLAIKDLHFRKETGANIIAWRPPDGRYIVNPTPDIVLVKNSSFIVLGNQDQLTALKNYLKRM